MLERVVLIISGVSIFLSAAVFDSINIEHECYSFTLFAEKHGTCAAPITGDEYNYFLTTLNLYFKNNVTEVLLEAGYVPSNIVKYSSSGIISVIKNAFHATPELSCKNGAIKEVRLCFTKDFKFRDCVADSDCPDKVSFPEFEFLDDTETKDWSIISGIKST
ncbi:ribonuclease 2-like [Bidens hawaiensis]|uniref:ribonuclease 2-like n=1 Tax=Bidens hawaiensis TaxID=980011 RepID=UPI0040499FF4